MPPTLTNRTNKYDEQTLAMGCPGAVPMTTIPPQTENPAGMIQSSPQAVIGTTTLLPYRNPYR